MQTTMKNLGTMTLAAALLATACLFSSPTKADVADAQVTLGNWDRSALER
jgi:hypothetical protein